MSELTEHPEKIIEANVTLKLGEFFTEARESKNLTLEDASNSLRLSVKQITALETNDFSILPEPMLTRGFIRNYAKFLEIDPEPLLLAYRHFFPIDAPQSIVIQSSNVSIGSGKNSLWLKYIVASVLIIIILAGWILYRDYMPNLHLNEPKPDAISSIKPIKNTPDDDSSQTSNVVEATHDEIAAQMNDSQTDKNSSQTQVVPVPIEPPAAATDKKPDIVKPEAIHKEPTVQASMDSAQPSGSKLRFSVSENSWIKVQDNSNKELLSKLEPAGSEEEVIGEPPFRIVIGNARGTKLMYQDKTVDLAPSTNNNVAHLTLE